MTKEEQKANELIDKFWHMEIEYHKSHSFVDYDLAKQAAIICVDEIIEALTISLGNCELKHFDKKLLDLDFEFWKSVKQHILNKGK